MSIENNNKINKKVRKTIEDIGGTMPEDLPVADSIKKLDKKDNKNQKGLNL